MEKHLTVLSAQLVGISRDGVWSHTYSFAPPLPEQAYSQGTLYAVVTISAGYGVDLPTLGRDLLSRLEREYYGSVNQGILTSLESSVRTVYQSLLGYGLSGLDFNLIAAVTWGPVVYFASVGDGRVYVYRNKQLSLLLGTEAATRAMGTVSVPTISGPMQNGDIFVLGSPRFFEIVPEESIGVALDKGVLHDSVDTLVSQVFAAPDSADACAIFLSPVTDDVPSEEDELVLVEPEKPVVVSEPVSTDLEEGELIISPSSLRGRLVETSASPSVSSSVNLSNVPPLSSQSSSSQKTFFLGRLFSFVHNLVPRWGSSGVHLRTTARRFPRKFIIIFAVLLLVVLVVITFSGKQKQEVDTRGQQFNSLYSTALAEFEQAKAMVENNIPGSRQQLLGVKGKLDEAKKLHYDDKKVDVLVSQIDEQLKASSREFVIDSPQTFMELSLIKQGAQASSESVFGNKLGFFDASANSFYQIDMSTKAQSIVAGGADVFGGSSFAALYSDFVYVFNKDKGIIQYDIKAKSAKTIVSKDPEWNDIVAMQFYAGRVYLLDRGKNQIWIHESGDGGFGPAKAWLTAGVAVDFSRAVGFTIDGSVWVLYSSGDVDKFLRGNKESYIIGELSQPLSNPRFVYTGEPDVVKHLYVVDGGSHRIVVLNKDNGQYYAQYSGDIVGQAVGVVADEKEKRLFIITPSTVYVTPLR